MGIIISIVSGKGGVGKTTLCANLAFSLALDGRTVITLDTDTGLRNLDILLGLENKTPYDLLDILEGRCTIGMGIAVHDSLPNLHFIPGSEDYTARINRPALRKLCRHLSAHYDYVLIDAPAGVGEGFRTALSCAQRCIVVSTPDLTAVRDASRTAAIAAEISGIRADLVINKVRKRMINQGYLQNIDEVMDAVSLPLLGLIPHDDAVVICSNRGEILPVGRSVTAQSFLNIAGRLQGRDVPLATFWRT